MATQLMFPESGSEASGCVAKLKSALQGETERLQSKSQIYGSILLREEYCWG